MTQIKVSFGLKGKLHQAKDTGKFYYSLTPVIKEAPAGGLTDADRREIINKVQAEMNKG